MHVIVSVKHVIDTTEIRVDKKTGELVLRGLPTKINDYDKNAVEEAVKIKKETGGSVSLISVGTKESIKTLKEALAMGADKAYLATAPANRLQDPKLTTQILGAMIRKIGLFDVVLCGEVSEDGYNFQVGPRLAQYLNIPHVGYVTKLTLNGRRITAERTLEDEIELVGTKPPVLLTINSSINLPRLPTAIQVMKIQANRIVEWSLKDLGLEESALDNAGVKMLDCEIPTVVRKNIVIEGSMTEAAAKLLQCLEEEGVL
jgi:electron transfer flavoprotein beta subunit